MGPLLGGARKLRERVGRLTARAFSAKNLLATNVCIYVSLSGAGDLLQQGSRALRSAHTSDLRRTFNLSAAALPMGLMGHYWYLWLDRRFVGTGGKVLAKKVLLDQMVVSPVMWLVYLCSLSLLQKHTDTQVENLREKGTKIYLTEWLVWPPAQLANFYFLPTRFRMLFDSVISLGFDWYTSFLIYDHSPS